MGIRLENLVVRFGDFKAINDVTLQIPKGKLVSLLGPSGSGKSTTLFTISGIHKPSGGKIFFGDRDVTGLEPEELGIGLVFQNYALYPHMTVRENILFPLKNLKWNKEEAEKRVKSNLDTKLRVETRQEIRRIQKETGVTAIFVTHDQEEAMCISDEIVLMKNGAIQQVSSPSDIYLNPVNKFVASFIGSPEMNFVDVDVKDGKGIIDTLTLENLPKDKSKVVLGVRAEDFEVSEEGLKTTVVTVEILGRERLLTLNHKGATYKMLVDKEFFIDEGAELTIRPKQGKSYVFDAESEEFITKC